MSRPIITLISDFGPTDSYAAQMKGAILEINRDVHLVDITHAVPPQNVRRAASILDDTIDSFPERTIHVVVVDPGVGTNRRLVGVETAGHRFIAPDNGVLSAVCRRGRPERVVDLTEARYWRQPVSNTFHGRDIMAPVAAQWSLGTDLGQFGSVSDRVLAALALPQPIQHGDALVGEILWNDRFGNLITNIDATLVPEHLHETLVVESAGQRIEGISRCYGDKRAGTLLALFGSSGRLEIAVNQGSAAGQLRPRKGERVRIVGFEASSDE